MDEALFAELLVSARQAVALAKGKGKPARVTVFDDPDVRAIRARYQLSQQRFAALMGISVDTLQNWEQGRRRPEGPARVLLRVAERFPEAVLAVARDVAASRRPPQRKPPVGGTRRAAVASRARRDRTKR